MLAFDVDGSSREAIHDVLPVLFFHSVSTSQSVIVGEGNELGC